jgi:hypothetical protein
MKVEHVMTLFGSDAGFRSTIWLEGKRVLDAGFKPGEEYTQFWFHDKIVCVSSGTPYTASVKAYDRKVSKQGKNPAIRIEGKRVQELFGEKFLNVKATFEPGKITIEGNDPLYVRSIPGTVQTEEVMA